MNILMLNPPFLHHFSREQRSPAVTKSGTFYYPMWLCYSAGVLEDNGHDVILIDAPADDSDNMGIMPRIKEFSPELIVVDTSTPTIYNDIDVAVSLKKIIPSSFVVLVGPHVSALPEESLRIDENIDAVARREYDYTIRDLAYALENHKDLNSVLGLSFRADGKIIHNPDRPLPENLDEIPFVARAYKRHLDIRDYFYGHSRYPIVTIVMGRGCPYRCVYCVYPQTFGGKKYRYRSARNVVDEMEFIIREFPDVKEIMFEDDTLTANKRKCRELCEEIIRRKLKILWSANSRADVDTDTLRIMKTAGCRLLCVGIESGVQNVLDQMKKNLKVDRIREFMRNAKKAGILVHGCFLLGTPGETRETLRITLDFAKELGPDTAQFFPIMVYPGTEAYDWAEQNGYLSTTDFSKWLTPDGLHYCVVSRPGLTNTELVNFCDNARREFYLRPAYIVYRIKRLFLHPGEDFPRLLKMIGTFWRYLVWGSVRKVEKGS